MRYVILAQSQPTACALNAWLDLLGVDPLPLDDPRRIIIPHHQLAVENGVQAYHDAVERIAEAGRFDAGEPAGHTTILADSVRPDSLSAIGGGGSWDHLLALLILTFPEACWVFGVIAGEIAASQKKEKHRAAFPKEEHQLAVLVTNAARNPLLDPTGLRDWVRRKPTKR